MAVVQYVQDAKLGFASFKFSSLSFRDDLQLHQYIEPEIVALTYATGTQLVIQHLIRMAYNDRRLASGTVIAGSKRVTVVCSPIPVVCEMDSSNGVFIMAYEGCCELPPDLENILLIFGRLVSNWLSKYDDCMLSRFEAAQLEAASIAVQRTLASGPALESDSSRTVVESVNLRGPMASTPP
jgi:hypothetical protein